MLRRNFLSLIPATAALAQEASPFQDASKKLIQAALADEGGWRKLSYLCDRIGHRLAGSPSLDQAIQWCAGEMKREGLENVQTPLVRVPNWVRGEEGAMLVQSLNAPIAMLGLGGSVATPPEGITADVVVVTDYDELEALGTEKVRGKIVLYDVPWQGYGRTVAYRSTGAVRAAKLGAVAALLRSVTPFSLRSPHTGQMNYADGVPRIPFAAVSVEDAGRMHRLSDTGATVRVELKMSAKTLPDADSANVIGEFRGRETPEEIVVLGGHIDSWDVGTGAQDDGSGCAACWQAVVLMKQLGLRPRRTVRVVLFTNEENGLRGAQAYREWAGDSVSRHVAAIEMDGGAERPSGYGLGMASASAEAQAKGLAQLKSIGTLLDGIGAGAMNAGGGGADIGPLMRAGVPGLGLRTTGGHYFDWHHTNADTLDKIDPQDFRRCVASLAVVSYCLAEMSERLGA